MKKMICLMLTAVLMLLSACSNETPVQGGSPKSSASESEEGPESSASESEEDPESSAIESEGSPESAASEPESGETQAEAESDSEVWELPLDCEYVQLDLDANSVRHGWLLEIEKKALVYTLDGNISAYSLKTGEQLYSFYAGGFDETEQMEKSTEKEGFDYRLLFKDRIVYYSSGDPSKTLTEDLPDEIKKDTLSAKFTPAYSENEAYFVWASSDGIMLMDRETGESKLLLNNANIESDVVEKVKRALFPFSTTKGTAPFFYFEPQLICGGTKVVAQVTSSDDVYRAFVVYDLAQDTIETGFSYLEQWSPDYPIFDRYIFLSTDFRNVKILKITDAETGESEDFAFGSRKTRAIPLTEDCETFFVANWSHIVGMGIRTYICSRDDLSDEGDRDLFSVIDEETVAYIEKITEDYIYVFLHNGEKRALCAIKYTL